MTGRVAVLWRGDAETRRTATQEGSRLRHVFAALAERGILAEPAVWCEECNDAVRQQLSTVDGVLVWVDPISDGRDRFMLNDLLREVAAGGVWVSTHPDVTSRMGVKEVLYTTRTFGWGTDTSVHRIPGSFRQAFPVSLRDNGPRVIKQNRGNGGQGVWKVEIVPCAPVTMVRVLEGRRGSMPRTVPLDDFLTECEIYFANGGCIIEQPFQPRLPEGMIRCYVAADKVVGFGHQLIKALIPPPPEGPDAPEAQPGPRIMHGADAPAFQAPRRLMETDWIPGMMRLLAIDRAALPIIWDADLLYGPRSSDGDDTYVLCEINVSSVLPIPDQAPREIARLVAERLGMSA